MCVYTVVFRVDASQGISTVYHAWSQGFSNTQYIYIQYSILVAMDRGSAIRIK